MSSLIGVAAQLHLAELHVERVEEQQPADERGALAERELENLRGLNAADDAR
jgi:hypothetical protein